MNTDGNMDAIERHLADCEEHDAWHDLQDQLEAARADAKEAEAYAEELEAKLSTCEKYRDAYAEMGRIGTQAVRDLEDKLAKVVEALEKLARLGNGDRYGNSDGNMIARTTLAKIKGESHE